MTAAGTPIPAVLLGRGATSDERRRDVLIGHCEDAEQRITRMIQRFDYDARADGDLLDEDDDQKDFAKMLIDEVHRWYRRWLEMPPDMLAPDFVADPHVVRIAYPRRFLPSRTDDGVAALVARLNDQCAEPCTRYCNATCDVHADRPANQDSRAPWIRFRVLGSDRDLRLVLERAD